MFRISFVSVFVFDGDFADGTVPPEVSFTVPGSRRIPVLDAGMASSPKK